jgi:ABC-2 type transport system permease protein
MQISAYRIYRDQLLTYWRSFWVAAWLGWQIESNWTDPLLFAIYSLVKPLAGVMILVVMFGIITQGNFTDPLFTYMYVGNAFYMYVGRMMNGLAWAVMDDREHYKTLKYIYTAPVHFPTYLSGRSIAGFLAASIAVSITLVVGVLFLHVQIELSTIHWPLFFVSLIIGVYMLTLMGLILAGVMLLLVHHMWGIGEVVAGALYLFSGAIFPLEVLPVWLRWIGYLMPVTYWLELIRRALVSDVAHAYPTLSGLSDQQIIAILLGLTLVLAILVRFTFRWCEHQARERGLIDVITNY